MPTPTNPMPTNPMSTNPTPANPMSTNPTPANPMSTNISNIMPTNTSPTNTSPTNNHTGGGFTTDPSEFIAGQPVYKSYDDCCPPAIVNGNLKFGAPDQPVCGFGAVRGGSRKTKKQQGKKLHSKKSKQHSKKSKQRGGDWNAVGRSKPAVYSDAFNGPKGVFAYPEDMTKRTFDETQPNYSVNAI